MFFFFFFFFNQSQSAVMQNQINQTNLVPRTFPFLNWAGEKARGMRSKTYANYFGLSIDRKPLSSLESTSIGFATTGPCDVVL